jgi:choline dehydrogenase-like flavoprotein
LIQREVRLGFMLDQPAEINNRITIDPNHMDRLGNYRPVIHYDLSDYTKAGMEVAKETSDFIFSHLGIENRTIYQETDIGYFSYNGRGYAFQGAGHFTGGHVMGTAKCNSVVNQNQQVWEHENLFMVGCGNMPSQGTANPTLTMAALTFKAAETIDSELKKKEMSSITR